jgi:LmbE family N-acetylglucosaminyl deacetylase
LDYNKKVLFVSVHPDDETLGCGGTILKHKEKGDQIYWVILTTPMIGIWSNEFIERRKEQVKNVSLKYGFTKCFMLDYETTKLDQALKGNIIKQLFDIISEINPEIIYIPNRSDVHSDHRVAFECVFGAAKIFNHSYIKSLLMYECLSETEFAPPFSENAFLPNYFVDISEFLTEKIDVMRIYDSEIKEHPFPRSIDNIKALAVFRGAQAGVKYAEAFMILKNIWK